MTETRHVFVVWDSELVSMNAVLDRLQRKPPEGFTVRALGVGRQAVAGNLPVLLRDEIARAEGVVAVVDQPNGNMAWELGLALAAGRRVALGVTGAVVPGWIAAPPLAGVLTENTLAGWNAWPKLLGAWDGEEADTAAAADTGGTEGDTASQPDALDDGPPSTCDQVGAGGACVGDVSCRVYGTCPCGQSYVSGCACEQGLWLCIIDDTCVFSRHDCLDADADGDDDAHAGDADDAGDAP